MAEIVAIQASQRLERCSVRRNCCSIAKSWPGSNDYSQLILNRNSNWLIHRALYAGIVLVLTFQGVPTVGLNLY